MGTTTIGPGLVIQRNSAGNGTTAQAFRRAMAFLFQQNTPSVVIPGRLGSNHLTVTGTSGWAYIVGPGGALLTRSSQGAYIVPVPDAVTVETTPPGGINPRWDRIYIHQPDPALDGPSVDVGAVIGVAIGTAAASPELPSIPVGALELSRTLIPANALRTSDLTFTNLPAVVGLNVGTVQIANGGTGATTKAAARTNLGFLSGTGEPPSTLGDDGDTYDQIL